MKKDKRKSSKTEVFLTVVAILSMIFALGTSIELAVDLEDISIFLLGGMPAILISCLLLGFAKIIQLLGDIKNKQEPKVENGFSTEEAREKLK
ncbi:MAG: hypothetical protein FWE04_00555 [Oscillospiraceae bacterium]|nr:hypothetical protein [Oscillospiraceae bacterium]